MRRGILLLALALVALMVAGPAVATPPQAATPIGGGLYLYSAGSGGFPGSHHFAIWQDTNGMGGIEDCSVPLGTPAHHVVRDGTVPGTSGVSRLEVDTCAGAKDTRLAGI
ncbi:MAG: hypothetical protein HY775_03560 [Acidobacteria bacterium]|nr:hypothetical protein [Acidobacteriota bacterium]